MKHVSSLYTIFTSVDLSKAHCFGPFVLGLALFRVSLDHLSIYMAPSKLGLGWGCSAKASFAITQSSMPSAAKGSSDPNESHPRSLSIEAKFID